VRDRTRGHREGREVLDLWCGLKSIKVRCSAVDGDLGQSALTIERASMDKLQILAGDAEKAQSVKELAKVVADLCRHLSEEQKKWTGASTEKPHPSQLGFPPPLGFNP